MRKLVSRPLVLCCDDAYAPAALVCLTSVFLNSPTIEFGTYLITSDRAKSAYNPRVIAAVETISDIFSRNIQIVPIDDNRFDNFKRPDLPYLGNITYTHLLIPSVIKSDNYVYLDSDIIVQENLEYLFLYDLGGNLIAGVSNGTEQDKIRLHLPLDDEYVNSGVLIVNAALWRRERVFEMLLDWYAKNTDAVLLADQDMINAPLAGRKEILHEKWNTQLHTMSSEDYETFDENGFRGVFHFTGSNKPWHLTALEKHKALYEKYARVSPLRMPNVDLRAAAPDLNYLQKMARAVRAIVKSGSDPLL